MSRSVHVLCLIGSALASMNAGCSSDASWTPDRQLEVASGISPAREVTDQTLTAGFATVDLTWRAGAKPGQVGTEANLVQLARLWGEIIPLVAKALSMQRQDDVVDLLRLATDFTKEHLARRIDAIRYDSYATVYQPGRGLHTRSSVKALVIENRGQKVALVRADLYLMQKHLWRRVTELVAEETGLAPEQILIAATHNHSAADAAFTAAGISTIADDFDPRHFVWISHQIAEAIRQADQNRVPARMGAIKTQLRAVQRNIIGPATAQVVPPGGTEPVEVHAGYPRDFFEDGLWVLHFDDATTGQRLGAYFVFGMHPESLYDGHGLLSSDFVGLTEAGLEARWGVPVMWSPGSLGDIEPDDGEVFGTDYWREDFVRLEQQAAVLVEAIAPALEDAPLATDQVLEPRGDLTINSRLRVFPGADNTNFPSGTPWQVPITEYLSEDLPVMCSHILPETDNVMLQAIQLGDVLLLGSPSEVTTDLGMHIRSRLDAVEGNLYQGYIWPDSEDWVMDTVQHNFDPIELSANEGFAMPIVLSQVNDYVGYMVTRWEFNNRTHYRQSMTLFGADTANYVAARLEGLALELRGDQPEQIAWDDPSVADLPLEDEVYSIVAGLEAGVTEFSRNIPSNDVRLVGRVTKSPTLQEADEMGASSMRFGWRGATSDLPIATVQIEHLKSNGQWESVMTEANPHLWVLYSPGGRWEAVWHLLDSPTPGTYRFRVDGLYRGKTSGTSAPDPLWDPDGRNAPYHVLSDPFEIG